MDDAEAEDVLLELAHPLEWFVPDVTGIRDQGIFAARVGLAMYGYGPVRDKAAFFATFTPVFGDNTAVGRKEYSTLATAKAACERHHVTGKWE